MDFDRVAHELDQMGYLRRDARFRLWDLTPAASWRRKAVEQHVENQTGILQQVLSAEREVYLIFSEDPVDNEVQGDWQEVSESHWRVPSGLDAEHLRESYLHYGNWRLYLTHKPVSTPFPDLFRSSVDDIIAFVNGNGIALAIDSFHDDLEWAIVLGD